MLPSGKKGATSEILHWFITSGPQLHLPTLPCTGRTREHQAQAPGEQHASRSRDLSARLSQKTLQGITI